MIQFKTINDYDEVCNWQYASAEELEKVWRSDDIGMDVPANDATVFDVEINGDKKDFPDDDMWFEDFLTFLGIDIWA